MTEDQHGRLTPEDLAIWKRVGNVRISPDGETVLFTVTEPDLESNRRLTSLWCVPYAGGAPEVLMDPTPVLALPEWSPDGSRIAFIADSEGEASIWILEWASRARTQLQVEAPGHGPLMTDDFYAALDWSPDNKMICFVAQGLDDPEDPFTWQQWHQTEAYPNLRRRIHIWTVDASGGMPMQMTGGDSHHAQPRWSPDGRWIAFASNRSGQEEAVKFSINQKYRIWVVPAEGGEAIQLTDHDGPNVGPCWSEDGKRIAYTWTRANGTETDVFAIRVLDLESRRAEDVTTCATFDYSMARLDNGNYRSQQLLFSAEVRGQMRILRVRGAGGDPQPISAEGCCSTLPRWSNQRNRVAFIQESPNGPAEVWVCGADGGGVRRLTFTNPEIEAGARHRVEVIQWRSYDGLEIEGFLVAPAGVSGPTPLIVYPHGGPHSATLLNFSLDFQVYASLGYAVFAPNIRGSSGYGQKFVDADRGDYGGGDYQDMMCGVDHLIATGRADADRLFILGGSYGGFMACWAVGHTDRFRAAVASCSITDLYSFYGQTEIPSWIEWSFGLPWENADLLRAHSPTTFAHRIRTPILLTHGQNDLRVPLAQSQQIYRILKRQGVETQLVVYPGEGHPILQPRHAIDLLHRKVEWLARHGGIAVHPKVASA